jgi:para-nitrobenzyl esterase
VTNNTPLLTGVTADEFTGFDPNRGKRTVTSFRNELAETYGALSAEAIALYPAHTDAEAQAESSAHSRDRSLGSMYSYLTAAQSTNRTVYAYLWTHPLPGPESARWGAFHSSELPYFFDTLDVAANRPFQAVDRALATKLSTYWVNFVNTGNPNGKGLPDWPRFTSAERRMLELGDPIRPRTLLEENKLALFDRYKKNGGRLELN